MPESAEQSAWYPLLRTYERESAMISTFNLEKLSSLLQDFYTVTRIRITVFDENFNEIVSYPGQRADFCRLVRPGRKGEGALRPVRSGGLPQSFLHARHLHLPVPRGTDGSHHTDLSEQHCHRIPLLRPCLLLSRPRDGLADNLGKNAAFFRWIPKN